MKELPIHQFIDQLASKEPTPGGGAAAAVSASLGVGSILMAIEFSNSKKLSGAERAYLDTRIQQFQDSKDQFIEMIDRDAEEFAPLAQAYRMPINDADQIKARQEAIQDGLVMASQVPIELITEVGHILQSFDTLLPLIKKTIVSDIGVGLQQLRAAVQASALNVYMNANQLTDPSLQQTYRQTANEQAESLLALIDRYYEDVKTILVK